VLSLLDIPHDPDGFMGRSLAPLLTGSGTVPPAPAAAETVRRGAWYTLRQPPLKYVLDFSTCGEQLFDLDADPGERRDLSAERPDDLEAMRRLAGERLHRSRVLALPEAHPSEDEEVRQALIGLGYVPAPGDPIGDPTAETTDLRPGRCFADARR
jgi:hypothetical protein